ncbi:MAG: hypothetical protein ACRD28_10725 [Acidobacteriaceae bacterium]
MRPMTQILLYCADENLLAAIAFALRLRRYQVAAVSEAKQAMEVAGQKDTALACGVLVHAQRGDPAGRLIHLLLASGSRIPLLLVDRAGDLAPVRYADMVLYGRNTKMVHILAALDTLRHRNPGPKPRSTV